MVFLDLFIFRNAGLHLFRIFVDMFDCQNLTTVRDNYVGTIHFEICP